MGLQSAEELRNRPLKMKLSLILLGLLAFTAVARSETEELMPEDEFGMDGPDGATTPGDAEFWWFWKTITITVTSASTSVTTTTTTSTSTTTCVPASFFVATTACRRRRGIMEESGLEAILPSEPKEVMASVAVDDRAVPELESSQHLVEAAPSPIDERFIFWRRSTTTVSTTTTSTSTSTSVTTSTSLIQLGTDTSVALCLPSGMTIC